MTLVPWIHNPRKCISYKLLEKNLHFNEQLKTFGIERIMLIRITLDNKQHLKRNVKKKKKHQFSVVACTFYGDLVTDSEHIKHASQRELYKKNMQSGEPIKAM
jgi:hypothetical protein